MNAADHLDCRVVEDGDVSVAVCVLLSVVVGVAMVSRVVIRTPSVTVGLRLALLGLLPRRCHSC